MKKILLLSALLALLALPAFGLAETWAEFVDLANDAMAGQAGEVSLRAPNLVTSDPDSDTGAPLVVPEGTRLTIKGGTFETMVLGGGEVLLSGVTVAGLPDADGILALPQGKEARLKLTIGEDSAVTATGTGRGIAADRWETPGSLEIENLGRMTAENGACADLRLTAGSGNNTLRFLNTGGIRSGASGIILRAQPAKGAASVTLANGGTITAAGETAVLLIARSDRRGAFATLENRSGAIIEQTGAEGAALTMEVNDTASGSASGQGLILNQGILRAGSEPVRLHAQGDPAVPVRIQQEGLLEENSGKIAPVAYVYLVKTDGGKPGEDALAALGQAWATAIDLGAMPTGTRLELMVLDEEGEEQGRLTVRGDGKAAEPARMTWKEFRAWAEEQLALSPGGELRLNVHATVGPPKGMDSGRDKGIFIPAGKKLTLVGGTYEQIHLAGGELELSGVHAQAVSIPAGPDAIQARLVIAGDSTLAATGEGKWAVYIEGSHKKACDITVVNHGRIESEDGGIDLSAAVVGEREIRLTIENQGKILTRGQAARLTATTQNAPAYLTLMNEGVIESTGRNAVELTGLSSKNSCWFLLQNGPEANLHCSTGNALYIRTLDPAAPAVNPRERVPELEEVWGGVVIENQGKIGGKDEPIQVESLLRALFPVEVLNRGASEASPSGEDRAESSADAKPGESEGIDGPGGTIKVNSEGMPELLLTVLYHAEKESRVVTQEEFDEVVRGHVKSAYTLPKGLRVGLRLRVPATAEIPEELFFYEGEL